MKKLISIFLMCWLPLFMQSAWAMSTQMLTQEAGLQPQVSAQSEMPCHQMAKKSSTSTSQQSNAYCNHCVACSIVNASASFSQFNPNFVLQISQYHPLNAAQIYLPITLPASIKPPIFLA